jgi:hypothetical protein
MPTTATSTTTTTMMRPIRRRRRRRQLIIIAVVTFVSAAIKYSEAKLADRSRIVKARQASRKTTRYHDNGRPIEGPGYRTQLAMDVDLQEERLIEEEEQKMKKKQAAPRKIIPQQQQRANEEYNDEGRPPSSGRDVPMLRRAPEKETPEQFERKLSSQLTGCCYTYKSYSAEDLCYYYGQDCQSGETPSHDSGDGDCEHDGLSFIGLSFSVNTASGNPYSYQLCDQFPMENIIDRDYDYVMSMDEDGWLVGGGYKTFDYSGKMPYIDSSHTELLRIGNLDPNSG